MADDYSADRRLSVSGSLSSYWWSLNANHTRTPATVHAWRSGGLLIGLSACLWHNSAPGCSANRRWLEQVTGSENSAGPVVDGGLGDPFQYILGGAQAIQDDGHVRIDVIYQLFSPRVRRVMDILSYLLMICFLSIVVYYGTLQAHTSWLTGETSGAGWNSHAPMYMKMAIPVGAALMVLQSVQKLIQAIKGARAHVG